MNATAVFVLTAMLVGPFWIVDWAQSFPTPATSLVSVGVQQLSGQTRGLAVTVWNRSGRLLSINSIRTSCGWRLSEYPPNARLSAERAIVQVDSAPGGPCDANSPVLILEIADEDGAQPRTYRVYWRDTYSNGG